MLAQPLTRSARKRKPSEWREQRVVVQTVLIISSVVVSFWVPVLRVGSQCCRSSPSIPLSFSLDLAFGLSPSLARNAVEKLASTLMRFLSRGLFLPLFVIFYRAYQPRFERVLVWSANLTAATGSGGGLLGTLPMPTGIRRAGYRVERRCRFPRQTHPGIARAPQNRYPPLPWARDKRARPEQVSLQPPKTGGVEYCVPPPSGAAWSRKG